MIDENQNGLPENPEENTADKAVENFKAPEVPTASPAPQTVAPVQDDTQAAQTISSTLQNTQPAPPSPQPSDQKIAEPQITGGDQGYIKAAEEVIRKDKEDPYKEQEDHEDVQVKYLKDRFGKEIKKGD